MGMLPVKVKACRKSISLLGIANAFACGVFVGISIMHIMPEQVGAWDEIACNDWLDDQNNGKSESDPTRATKEECPDAYPLPFLLLAIGYTIMLLLDKVVFDSHALLHGHGDKHDIIRKSRTRASIVVQEQME